MQHRAAPDQRLVAGIQKSNRDDFEPVSFERLNAVVAKNFGLRVDAEHQRDVGPVDVGIEQADLVSELRQDNREIDGERGLSHTAFAGTDGDDSAYTGKGCGDGGCCGCPGRGGRGELMLRLYVRGGQQRARSNWHSAGHKNTGCRRIAKCCFPHTAKYPPSTGNAAPVAHDDSSLAR